MWATLSDVLPLRFSAAVGAKLQNYFICDSSKPHTASKRNKKERRSDQKRHVHIHADMLLLIFAAPRPDDTCTCR